MFAHGNELKFDAEECIYNEGGPSDAVYIVKEGYVGIYRTNFDGALIPLTIIGKNEFLGEIALILNKNHSTTARAITPTTLVKIDRHEIDPILASTNPVVKGLLKSVLTRLMEIDELVKKNNLTQDNISEQISKILLEEND